MEDLELILNQIDSTDSLLKHEAVEKIAEYSDSKAIERLVQLLSDCSPLIKDEAVNSLAKIGGEETVKAVVPLLYSKEVSLKNISLEILTRLGDVAVGELSARLDEPDDDVLKFIVDIIGLIGNHEPVRELIPLLKHANPNIRAAVAVAFDKMGANEALDALMEALADDDEWVRFSVLEALGSIGGARVTEKLLDVFRAIDVSRIAALDALSMLAEPEDCKKVMAVIASPGVSHVLTIETVVRFVDRFQEELTDIDKGIFLEILSSRLHEADVDDQREALRGLKLLAEKSAMDSLLLFSLNKDYDEETRDALKRAIIACADTDKIVEALTGRSERVLVFVEALADIKDPSTVEVLASTLKKSTDTKVRVKALQALGNIATSETYDSLVEALQNDHGNTRKAAARGLSNLVDTRAVAPLLEALLKEPYDDVIEAIASSLSSLPGASVEETFISLLSSEREAMRVVGLNGLAGIPTEKSSKALSALLTDEEASVRSAAVSAIGAFDGEAAADLLSRALEDPEKEVRLAALDVFSSRSGGEKFIMKGLDDADMWVRFKAASSLAEKKYHAAEEKLIELLRDDEVPVQITAARALAGLSSVKAADTLRGFLDHSDSNLREAAAAALEMCAG